MPQAMEVMVDEIETLHVDVCTRAKPHTSLSTLVIAWLKDRYSSKQDSTGTLLPVNQLLELDYSIHSDVVSIRVYETSSAQPFINIDDYNVEVHAYKPHDTAETVSLETLLKESTSHYSERLPYIRVTPLPCSTLDSTWNTLVFEPRIQDVVFDALVRLLSMKSSASTSKRPSPSLYLSVCLFWGPPGSGKTSLCKAIANRLSIRMRPSYWKTRLVELDPHSLYSKYFSESAKMVGVALDAIGLLIDQEPESLVIVLIDEIESLSGSRCQSLSASEPQDAMRAVNALLTGLDRLRMRPNFMVFCTSNLIQAMDIAFLDRVDIKWHIPGPCSRACYEILRQCMHELLAIGWIGEVSGGQSSVPASDDIQVVSYESLPDFGTMLLRRADGDSDPAKQLWDIAQKCESLSGRNLQRLPILSLALHSRRRPCPLDEALHALAKTVAKERTA